MTDLKGTIIFVNDFFCKISGYNRDELIGANHRILKSGFHSPEFYAEMWHSLIKKKLWCGEICDRRKDGSFYWVSTAISTIAGPNNETLYLAIQLDITSRKEAEKQLLYSSKMSSLGEMAGGIAHEINSPLSIILDR